MESLEEMKKIVGEENYNVNGGYKFKMDEDLKLSRRAIWEFLKEVGLKFFEGKEITRVSLPVTLCEPRSFLQKLTDYWTSHQLLRAAAAATDPVERFKKVMAFAVSGIHATCVTRKAFNPILGETYEARSEDGTEVFLEQTSHHPPIAHWVVRPDDGSYSFNGYASLNASLRGNSLVGRQTGRNAVLFGDGTEIEWDYPKTIIAGLVWGDRVMDYEGEMVFHDKKNKLRCVLNFNPDKKGFFASFFSRSSTPSDTIRGELYQYDRKPEESTRVIGDLEGSWLECLDFTNKATDVKERLWDIETCRRFRIAPVENPLPSDSRFRKDVISLAEKNIDEARKWKYELEEKQRREAKLRKEYASKNSS